MDEKSIKELIGGLHPLERKILIQIPKSGSLNDIANNSGLKEVQVMRAVQWLQNKAIITVKEQIRELIELDKNGKAYMKTGLPERRFLSVIQEKDLSLRTIETKSGLDKEEFNVAFGVLRRKLAITIENGKAYITENGRKLLFDGSIEEQFLKKLPREVKDFSEEDKFAFEELKKRKLIIKNNLVKSKVAELTEAGQQVVDQNLELDVIDVLNPDIIRSRIWKTKEFRRYDIKAKVPLTWFGRRHFTNEAIEYIRRIWIELGFQEMQGPIVQTSFWNFDSLFTAQDHPVREMQDTFFIREPAKGSLPDKKLVERVRSVHENGADTGSTGWQYRWNEEEAKKNVLRTHTTCLSAKTISQLKETDLPAKYFSIGRCFRNETLDWSHLFEFDQVEGIVVAEDVNFRNLIAYLKTFYHKMGYKDVRIRPGYFPYTEMSCEVDVLHPVHNKWMELGGAGIFRPEVVKTLLGKDVPVLAWGLGLARTISEYYNISDLRDLYKNDLKQLREVKAWLK